MGGQAKCLERIIDVSIFKYPYFIQKIENVLSELGEKIIIELDLLMEDRKKEGSQLKQSKQNKVRWCQFISVTIPIIL